MKQRHSNSPEQPHQEAPDARTEKPPAHQAPSPETMKLINVDLERISDVEARFRLFEGIINHGAPFAAFLRLPDVAAGEPTVIDRFTQSYAGSWPTLEQFIHDQLEALGWHDVLDALRRDHGIGPDVLDWNLDGFLVQAREVFDIVELDGWQHIFAK